MFIGICGGICAGKRTVAKYLIEDHGFKALCLEDKGSSASGANDGKKRSMRRNSFQEVPFSELSGLLDFVTRRWRERWLITDISSEAVLDAFMRRPFFLLISVDAPVLLRWKRHRSRCIQDKLEPAPLADFVAESDKHLFDPPFGLAHLIDQAQLRLLNSSNSIDELYRSLRALNLTNEERLRPSWDQYFMRLASLAAQRSNCMKRRVGCVLVREKRVISTGYNGTPRNIRNCNEGGCPRCNGAQGAGVGLATCLCIHAEENALLEAGRERIREGCILYCDTCPCLTCSIKITQVGISEVVYSQSYSMDDHTAAVFKEAGINLRQFTPPRNGLVDLEGFRAIHGGHDDAACR